MTGWSDIITTAMTLIDDIRWREDLAANPALFYRAKSDYVKLALPMMNRPPEFQRYLEDQKALPSYGSAEWVSTQESVNGETTVAIGLIGFSLCSVSVRSPDGMTLTPYLDATYNASAGTVTFPRQNAAGIRYDINCYTDGQFAELTPTMMRLFSLAIAVVWDERFDRNWLNDQMKIKDSSFETVNEASYMKQTGEKMSRNRAILSDELRKYEQDCAYRRLFSPVARNTQLF